VREKPRRSARRWPASARLVWLKRRWRCREECCPVKTWTEQAEAVLGEVGHHRAGRARGAPSGGPAGAAGG
jgi:hypothetical protein